MQIRVASAVGGLLVALLVGVSLAGASSSPFKRYTLPAASPFMFASPGTLTVSFPSGWEVKTAWPPKATAPHDPVTWEMGQSLWPEGTTLAGIRESIIWTGCRKGWGYEKLAADTYQTLPVGRVWHYTMRVYNDKACTSAAFDMQRYWLDRKLSHNGQEVFLIFDAFCRTNQCQTRDRQFAAIMHSIRLLTS